jgi:phosphoribosyl-ATP pyrophosphohydrolase/phosphoribosyl-AMP cyclohydrolase
MNFSKSKDGLIPAIIQDETTSKVLMLGYMNEEALEQTRKTGKATFFSRSKSRLWTKGESSGNFLIVSSILEDCDKDTLLIKVNPSGPVCHTGAETCFGEKNTGNFLDTLGKTIRNRKENPGSNSYTAQLFSSGINKIAQKVGEEAVELIIEAKDNNENLFLNEAADLLYHYMVLLAARGYGLKDVSALLEARSK